MAKKYIEEVKDVLDSAEEVKDEIDPKAEKALREQIKREAKQTKRVGGVRIV